MYMELTAQAALPSEKEPAYLLDRRLNGPHRRSRREGGELHCGVIYLFPASYLRGIQFDSQQKPTIIAISLIALIPKLNSSIFHITHDNFSPI
jgi:hypothetical protein